MTTLDILFWLLAALLGGCIWAIEVGLASRHRQILLSSMASSLLTMLYIMFWVDDVTKLIPFDPQKFEKAKAAQGEGSTKKEGGGKGGGKGGNGRDDSSSSSQGNGDGSGNGGGGNGSGGGNSSGDANGNDAANDDGGVEYRREPFKDCPVCPDLVIVPRGVAQVGSPADEPHRQPDEQVAVMVPVAKPLAVGRLEILRQEYAAFIEETRHESRAVCDAGRRRGKFDWQKPGFEQDERHPVVCVSPADIQLYLAWLSAKAGRTYRLPNEIEWEHAARAGTQTAYSIGPAVNRTLANVGKSRDGTTVGGLFTANQWGISDAIGNVWEVTSVCMAQPGKLMGAQAEQPECRRLLKGGAWSSASVGSRHAVRRLLSDGFSANDIGFRVVREVDERDSAMILTPAQKKQLAQDEKVAAEIAEKERVATEEARKKQVADAEAKAKKDAEKAAKSAKK